MKRLYSVRNRSIPRHDMCELGDYIKGANAIERCRKWSVLPSNVVLFLVLQNSARLEIVNLVLG